VTDVLVRAADPGEGARLREIAVASKSRWGYDLERVERWAADGDFSPEGLSEKEVYVAEVEGRAIGWASLIPNGDVYRLDDLWVEPRWMGRGVGTRLFRHAVERARRLGGRVLEWEAEPNAVGFYERMGARRLRAGDPSAWGRVLPVMGIELEATAPPG
jgi:GNAT superfamily N-acetyltransferase